MKIMRKVVATILVAIFSVSCICCMSAFANENNIYKSIDSELKTKLDALSDNDKVPVAIWYKDLNMANVNSQICDELDKSIDNDKISEDTLNLFKLKINDESISRQRIKIEDIDKNVSTSDGTYLNKLTRNILKRNYISYYQKILNKFDNVISKKDIIFVSHYAPYLQANLTKSQIENISNSNYIDKICYFDKTQIKSVNCSDLSTMTTSSVDEQSKNLTATGIKKLTDEFKLTGKGVNVGVIDDGFSLKHLRKNFSRINLSTNVYGTLKDDGTHGDYVSAIIGAKNNEFSGAISDCNMYFASGSPNFTESFEWLVDKGCNVINSSFLVGNGSVNTYDSFAKWLDSVSQRANVNIVLASGNNGKNKVCSMAMSYNSIVVGNCDNDHNIASDSSYVDLSNTAYKPDIVAQGINAVSYTAYDGTENFRKVSAGGTSSAAPLVTSAVVQLCQYSALLMNNPMLVKSILLDGATYVGEKNKEGSIGDFNAFDRQTGAGILDAYKALLIFRSQNTTAKYVNKNTTTFESSVVVGSNKKTVRILVNYSKLNYVGDNTTDITNITEKPLMGLEVTVTYTGLLNYTYYSRTFNDNKVSVVFDPPRKGTYKIVVHAINNSVADNTLVFLSKHSL